MNGDKLVVGHRRRKVLILKHASGAKGQSGAILPLTKSPPQHCINMILKNAAALSG